MTKPADHHPLTHVVHSPPVLSVPFDPRPSLSEPATSRRST
jgi:tyrosine-protein kinase Etk/Wzc